MVEVIPDFLQREFEKQTVTQVKIVTPDCITCLVVFLTHFNVWLDVETSLESGRPKN